MIMILEIYLLSLISFPFPFGFLAAVIQGYHSLAVNLIGRLPFNTATTYWYH